jgi:acyl-CoA dehydrogenase
MAPLDSLHSDIRDGVRAVCNQFDSAYWQKVDHDRVYPEACVDALTKAGWLAALIPQEYGGSDWACRKPR